MVRIIFITLIIASVLLYIFSNALRLPLVASQVIAGVLFFSVLGFLIDKYFIRKRED